MTRDVREAALSALAAGLSVHPPRQDGSKAPEGAWKESQEKRATLDALRVWYGVKGKPKRSGVGVVCGEVSGNLECLEFDAKGEVYGHFKMRAKALGLGELVERIEAGYLERSPSGGIHWLYRCETIAGNTELAQYQTDETDPRTGKPKVGVLIETRGEGGYIVVAPSNGTVHPSGGAYELLRGGFATIATITPEEREDLWNLARSFDRMPETEHVDRAEAAARKAQPEDWPDTISPIDDYNARAEWSDLLVGWTHIYNDSDGAEYWRRPGKTLGWSATLNRDGSDRLYVFSSATEFETGRPYTKFAAYARQNHGDDFKAAVRALSLAGFGTFKTWVKVDGEWRLEIRQNPCPKGVRIAKPGEGPPIENKSRGEAPSATAQPSDDDSIPVPPRPWPAPPDEAVYCGLAGDIVRELEPHTEADPFGMVVQLLVMFGSAAGRAPHYAVEDTRHGCNENVVQVGDSAVGRKGTATDRILALFATADPAWCRDRIRGGLSSGEGLISAVRDPQWAKMPVKEKGRIVDYQDVMVDAGVDDKRLLVIESEFGGVLRVLDREGNKLSALLRQAWDSGTLASLTKNPLKATDAHISIVAHITADELLAHMSRVDLVNGLANRFLWTAVRRSKVLPFGGRPRGLAALADRLSKSLAFARDIGCMSMTPEARTLWEASYPGLTTPPPGKLGAVTSRGAPHTVRLAMLYALMDRSGFITAEHLAAALALWRASVRCAAFIFGDSLGNPDADKILRALRAEREGLTRSQIRERVFQRNAPAERITTALAYLLQHGMVREAVEDTGGRRAHRYYAIDAENAKSPRPSGKTADATPYSVNGVNGVPTNGTGTGREVIEL